MPYIFVPDPREQGLYTPSYPPPPPAVREQPPPVQPFSLNPFPYARRGLDALIGGPGKNLASWGDYAASKVVPAGFTFNPQISPLYGTSQAAVAPVVNAPVNPYVAGSSAANFKPYPVTTQAPPAAPKVKVAGGYTMDDLKNAATPLAKYGVTPEQLANYARSEMNRNDSHMSNFTPQSLAASAAADNIWAKEAQRVGVLTGNAAADNLIWSEHWAFNNGFSGRDPLLTGHPESVQRLQGQAEQMVKEQRDQSWGGYAKPEGDDFQSLRDQIAALQSKIDAMSNSGQSGSGNASLSNTQGGYQFSGNAGAWGGTGEKE